MSLQSAVEKTCEILDRAEVDQAHGTQHALIVLAHVQGMLACEKPPLHPDEANAIELAAVVHDLDDRKLFPENQNHENARLVLEHAGVDCETVKKVIEMVKLVSTSENGNQAAAVLQHWMLYPRFADRLEAIGKVGVERCMAYTLHHKRPLFLPTTPRAASEEELWTIATPERFQSYLKTKTSASFIDHFYDKLLHIGTLDALGHPTNPYMVDMASKRHQYMIRYILEFGLNGNIKDN